MCSPPPPVPHVLQQGSWGFLRLERCSLTAHILQKLYGTHKEKRPRRKGGTERDPESPQQNTEKSQAPNRMGGVPRLQVKCLVFAKERGNRPPKMRGGLND